MADAFHVPAALVSIVMENRQWFQAYSGIEGPSLAERGTARDLAFCNHVVEGRERTRDELVQRISDRFVDPVAFARSVRVLPSGPFAARATLRLRPRDGEQRPRPAVWSATPVRAPSSIHQLEVYRELPPRAEPSSPGAPVQRTHAA